ncbi:MAG: response regulator transcription factor [Cyclobacteriaceae bacterium]|jgi:two-component system alkaline phosphatase synthesis response regulator PhoP|nr:response regulator transcription factor [Cyclobacteriaceae bacterium]
MGKTPRILAVDDDPDILELLQYNLTKEGFQVEVEEDALRAIDLSQRFLPDLIILDIMMPSLTGIEVCRRLRALPQFKDTYIFFLTAKSEHYYEEAALDTGGDDFIEKVMGLRLLTNKVVHVLKRNFTIRKRVAKVTVGNWTLHRRSSSVTVRGETIALAKPEFDLLFFLAQNPKKTVTRESILGNLWGSDVYSVVPTVEACIDNLSRKLGKKWLWQLDDGRYRFRPDF